MRHVAAPWRTVAVGALAAALAAACAGALAATMVQGGATVEYPTGHEALAKRCLEVVAATRPALVRELGLPAPERLTVKLFAAQAAYDRFLGGRVHPHSLGVALPHARVIAINTSAAAMPTRWDFRATVKHELLHLAVGRLQQETRQAVPLWFNEGLAVWFSGQNILQLPRVLPRAAAAGAVFSLAQLAAAFPTNMADLSLAYEQSESAVGYLAKEHGAGALKELFDRMRRGANFEAALCGVTGQTLPEFEAAWRKSLRSRFAGWRALLYSGLSLFTLLAIGTIIAYAVMRMRARRRLRRWAKEDGEEDGWEDEEPPQVDEDFDVW